MFYNSRIILIKIATYYSQNHASILRLRPSADEIAPILQIIFTRSFNTHTLPQDWFKANITPVFKKGDRSVVKSWNT